MDDTEQTGKAADLASARFRRTDSCRPVCSYLRKDPAALPVLIIFTLALSFRFARFTGPGMTIMLLIICEQYQEHLRQAVRGGVRPEGD